MPPQVQLTPEQIANFQVDPSQWMQAVLGGEYLGANPYIDQLIQTMEADAQRQFQESILPTRKSELNLSGAYGSALGAQSEANAARDFAQGLMGQTAGIRYEDYGAERENMMRALQLMSGENVASRQGLFGSRDTDVQADTNIRTANIGRSGQLGAARIGANASMHNARLAQQAAYWNNLFGRSEQMRGFSGGPGGSMGQRQEQASTPPMATPHRFQAKQGRLGGDPWNSPGAW